MKSNKNIEFIFLETIGKSLQDVEKIKEGDILYKFPSKSALEYIDFVNKAFQSFCPVSMKFQLECDIIDTKSYDMARGEGDAPYITKEYDNYRIVARKK